MVAFLFVWKSTGDITEKFTITRSESFGPPGNTLSFTIPYSSYDIAPSIAPFDAAGATGANGVVLENTGGYTQRTSPSLEFIKVNPRNTQSF